MKFHISMVWILAGLIMATTAMAEDEGARLDRKLCSICHGPGGTTSSELFPQLAGQPATYLINQLKYFRDKSRSDQNATRFMWGISSRLTDDEIQHLAAFYTSQTPVHRGNITDQAQYDLGKQLFTSGRTGTNTPPCMACHGDHGQGSSDLATPRIGGQNEQYLRRQLKVFYGNDRPAAVAMHEIVKTLSQKDIEAIAQYLQAQ
jgi:cytochrome c553